MTDFNWHYQTFIFFFIAIQKKFRIRSIQRWRVGHHHHQVKILPLCPYAKKMMCGKEEYQDVL